MKINESVKEFKSFIQRRFKYQQYLGYFPRQPRFCRLTRSRLATIDHHKAPTTPLLLMTIPNSTEVAITVKRRDTKSESAAARTVTCPINNGKTVKKNRHSKMDRKITPNWCATHVITLAPHRETADTERKGHLRSAMSRKTRRIRTKRESSARNLSHHTKGPPKRSHRAKAKDRFC